MIVRISPPKGVNIVVKEGDQVGFQTPLYEKESEETEKIDVAKAISVSPNKIFNYLTKFVGEKVKKGEVLAIKKGFFSNKKCIANRGGIIKEINHQDGSLLLKILTKNKKSNFSFFKGTIKKISGEDLEIDIEKALSFPLREINQNFGGEVFYLKKISQTKVLSEAELEGKIVITHKLNTYSFSKFSTLGVKGYVLESKKNLDLDSNYGLIKKLDDLEKIFAYNLKYCLALKNKKELILYK